MVAIQEIQQAADCFFKKYDYRMCIRSIDGTHVNIELPTGEETDVFNYNKYRSVTLLAVADAPLKFAYVNIGAFGRCTDAFVYSRSTLFEVK